MNRTVISLLHKAAIVYSNKPYLWVKTDEGWTSKTFKQVAQKAKAFASALLKHGFQKNDSIAILAEGSANWVIGEFGIILSGCISIPLSIKLLPEEIQFRLNHSEARAVLVSNNNIDKVAAILKKIKKRSFYIICLDDDVSNIDMIVEKCNLTRNKDFFIFEDLINEGTNFLKNSAPTLQKIEFQIKEDDVVTISYTSGTTGNPKGIMLTHLNFYNNCGDAITMFNVPEHFRTLIILPCDHSFAHTVAIYTALLRGISLYFIDTRGGVLSILRNIAINLLETNPDFLLTVPALSGNFMKKIIKGIEAKGRLIKAIFKIGMKSGIRYYGNGFNKPALYKRILTYLPYKFADILIFKKVRSIFGNRIKFCVGGGAMLDIRQQEFFKTLGIPIYQGYGLTEAAPVVSSNTPDLHKLGTSGKLVPSVKCKIIKSTGQEAKPEEIGQIVINGENIMKGYFKNEEATANAIKDGWLYTGDLGYYDKDGFLVVVGREKALLISENGEKYSPEEIEEAIVNCSDFISQAVVYNDHRKYTTALIVLEMESVENFLKLKNIRDSKFLLEFINQSFYRFMSQTTYKDKFPNYWIPSTFQILLEPFTEQNRMINSTLKMVRFRIAKAYSNVIEYMYTPEGSRFNNNKNINALKGLFELEK